MEQPRTGTRYEHLCVLVILIVYLPIGSVLSQDGSLTIGGILSTEFEEEVFAYSVDFINQNLRISPEITLKAVINRTGLLDSFHAFQAACHQAEQGIVSLIGPVSSTAISQVAPVAEVLALPHLAPLASNPLLGNQINYPYLTRLMAPDTMQSEALIDLVHYFGWTRMAILTSDTDYGVQGLVRFQDLAANRKWRVVSVLQFKAPSDPSKTDATEQLMDIKDTGARIIILNCQGVYGSHVLRQAHLLGLMSEGWAWILTSGISSSRELMTSPPPDYLVGVIGTRPSTGRGNLYGDFTAGWTSSGHTEQLDSSSQLLADAVLTVAHAARHLHNLNETSALMAQSLSCEHSPPPAWPHGQLMLDAIRQVRGDGVASDIEFNNQGSPKHVSYDYVNMKSGGWLKVGEWTQNEGLSIFRKKDILFSEGRETVYDFNSSLANKTINIVTIEEPPFVSFTHDNFDEDNIDPSHIEGYCLDLLKKLSETIGFKYNIYNVKDGNFGIRDPITHQWNGIIKELVDHNADIGVTGLTITHVREQDVDFTTPYLDLGMLFVMKKPELDPLRPFSFMDPFSGELWMYIMMTAIVIGVFVSLLNKLSPYDHHGEFMYEHHDTQEKKIKKKGISRHMENYKEWKKFQRIKNQCLNELNFTNSTWFSFAALLQQGGETYPKSLSGRVISVLWWMGVVIIVATYTANLAAFLTASRVQNSINSVEDLATQTKIVYGTVSSSSIYEFFRHSTSALYQEMSAFMVARDGVVKTTKDGLERARLGGYAFVWDSAVLDYMKAQKPCNTLITVGREFGKIGYGFALHKNSPYKDELSTHILQLRENGFMDELKHKWYVERGECSSPDDTNSEASEQEEKAGGKLNPSLMLGVFYIIYGGLALSFLVLPLEWLSACLHSMHGDDPYKPKTLREAFRRRWQRQKADIVEDWIPKLALLANVWSVCGNKGDKQEAEIVEEPKQKHQGVEKLQMRQFVTRFVGTQRESQANLLDGLSTRTPSVASIVGATNPERYDVTSMKGLDGSNSGKQEDLDGSSYNNGKLAGSTHTRDVSNGGVLSHPDFESVCGDTHTATSVKSKSPRDIFLAVADSGYNSQEAEEPKGKLPANGTSTSETGHFN